MSVPRVERPRDLPELRSWMLKRYHPRSPMGFLDGKWLTKTLRDARLWWVEPEACHLLAETAPTWPGDAPLTVSDAPHTEGFAILTRDLIGIDTSPTRDTPVWVSAVAWGRTRLPPVEGSKEWRLAMSLAMFSRFDLDDADPDLFELELPSRVEEMLDRGRHHPPAGPGNHLYAYVGRTDWVLGTGADDPMLDNNAETPTDPKTLASMAEDRRLMAALWAIARLPVSTVRKWQPSNRAASRRATASGHDPTVRVLTLNPPAPSNGETGRDVHWRHRWIVTPHFTHQPYGPNSSLRKVILRGPYVKGPEDAPLIRTERVWRVR